MKKQLFVIAFVALFSACSTETTPAPLELDYSQLGKINLDVQNLSVVDRSNQVNSAPYIDNQFHPTIDDAIHQWVAGRLRATGFSGQATIIIKEASLSSQALPMEQGVRSWFERQQATKYTGRAAVDLEINGRQGYAIASAQAERTVSVPENPSAADKQDAYRKLLTGLMQDLSRNLNDAIHDHLQNFVVTAPILPGTGQ